MRIREWFWRLWRRKREAKAEPTAGVAIGERARRFEGEAPPVVPEDICLLALDYIADMLSDRRLVPSYLRSEIAAARRLPAVAWTLAREHRDACPSELTAIRSAALEHVRGVAMAVLREHPTGNWRP